MTIGESEVDWNTFSTWPLVLPPNRPTELSLQQIRSTIMERKPDSTRVAIMGSTPEFCDLLISLGFRQIYLFERSASFASRMSELRLLAASETVVAGDWRATFADHKGRFDVILSDFTSGNIPYADRLTLYQDIRRSLKTGGLFIDRVLASEHYHQIGQLDSLYENRPLNLRTINDFNAHYLFTSQWVQEAGQVDSSELYSKLAEDSRSSWMRGLAAATEAITPRGNIWHYGREHGLQPHLGRLNGFEVCQIIEEPPCSPYFGHAWQLVLRKSSIALSSSAGKLL